MRLRELRLRKAAAALIPICMLFAMVVQGEELKETSIGSIAGYYHSENNETIIMANGKAYDVEEDASLDGPYSLSVYSLGEGFLLETDGNYIYLQEQPEKGTTQTGGKYYALYNNFIGMEDDADYKEGKQVNISGFIFDNDYEVIERDSLALFFGVDAGDSDNGKMEGDGFDTPEGAAEAYIQGLADNDIDEMIKACAVETYVDNFSLLKYIERLRSINITMADRMVPSKSKFARQMNIESRRAAITRNIVNEYLVFIGSDLLEGLNVVYDPDEASIEDFISERYIDDDTGILSEIVFTGRYMDPDDLTNGIYSQEQNMENHKKMSAQYNVDDAVSLAPVISVAGKEYVLCLEVGRYQDKWYIINPSGMLGTIMGISAFEGGLCAVSDLP